MSFTFKLRSFVGTAACALAIVNGAMSPAVAQSRDRWLKDNESTTMTGYLLQGEDVYALCDEDCHDLNLFLFNEMGVMVDADEQIDSFPMVTAPYDGTFVIKVAVPSCTHWAGCAVSVSSDRGF
ncbi:MAG: hypothetical protein WBA76_03420 [Phormidesmis sp.]